MKYKDFYPNLIQEGGLSVPVIVIDVQPSYDNACRRIAGGLMDFLNKRTGKVIAYFNGPELGMEESSEVMEYYVENGLDYEKLDDIEFRDKTYAFFRNWMDAGMERSDIIKAIRYMVINRKYDSRDIDEEEWRKIYGDRYEGLDSIINGDMINIPDISVSDLKSLNGCYLCGGGREECLAEFRLIMDAFNIKYTLIEKFIY